jgi:HEAT repeat protein
MNVKRLCAAALFLAIVCQLARTAGGKVGIGQDQPTLPAKEATTETKPDEQLEINKNALLQGPSEEIRTKAAALMLFGENPLVRKILLDALRQTENAPARMAVCKALSQVRLAQKPIQNEADFVEPLINILNANEDTATTKLAAEATLMFEYDLIQKQLEEMATNTTLPAQARLNAVYVLKLYPDIRAAIRLISLVDDLDSKVAAAAQKALDSLGIPVGKDAETRKQDIDRLQSQGQVAFLRKRLIRLETEMRRLDTDRSSWQTRYLSELSKRYDSIADEAAKTDFLAEQLVSSDQIVKLWALEKVYQSRVGSTTKTKLPAKLGPILINLISDQNDGVRLRTAELLSLMGELNSAEKLLEQLESERDDEVKTKVFVALGVAVSSASLSNPPVKISPEIRDRTLAWAAKFLSEAEPQKVQKGAEVIKKLLEQNGLTSDQIAKYLGLLAEKHRRQKTKTDGTLRGELLSAMAGLCAQRSICRAEAAKVFRPLFEEALKDEGTDLARQAAVDGLINIDRATALSRLRKDFVNDPSSIVRKKLIDLAGEVGGQEDLAWLAEKIGTTGEDQPAWQAMVKIFKRLGVDVLSEWVAKFGSDSSQNKASVEQRISFLEVAEQKALAENKSAVLTNVRMKLAGLYSTSGQFEQAAKSLEFVRQSAQTAEEKQAILPDLLNAYLRWPKIELAAKLVETCLLEKDLDPNSAIVRLIDDYLCNPPAGTDISPIVQALFEIEIKKPQSRPLWLGQLRRWAERLGKAAGSDESKQSNNKS